MTPIERATDMQQRGRYLGRRLVDELVLVAGAAVRGGAHVLEVVLHRPRQHGVGHADDVVLQRGRRGTSCRADVQWGVYCELRRGLTRGRRLHTTTSYRDPGSQRMLTAVFCTTESASPCCTFVLVYSDGFPDVNIVFSRKGSAQRIAL